MELQVALISIENNIESNVDASEAVFWSTGRHYLIWFRGESPLLVL